MLAGFDIVLYGNHTPALGAWLGSFALASAGSVVVTYLALAWTQRQTLAAKCETDTDTPALDGRGRLALAGVVATAIVLLVVSSRDIALGLPTAIMGGLTALAVWIKGRSSPLETIKSVNWAVLPLVAGLFVLVEALTATGVVDRLATALATLARGGVREAAAVAGTLLAVGSNFTNNLPAGLVASSVLGQLHPDKRIVDGLLIGVDLGPNLSVTGSLATILWLNNLRRAKLDVSFWQFLKVGLVVMPPALLAALALRLLI
jgi:arsenical pump membrane protein